MFGLIQIGVLLGKQCFVKQLNLKYTKMLRKQENLLSMSNKNICYKCIILTKTSSKTSPNKSSFQKKRWFALSLYNFP